MFTESKGAWKQSAELKGSDTVAGDTFGSAVALSGTTAVVGAPDHGSYAGTAYVFTETKGAWKQRAELSGTDTVAGDTFGSAVAISGTTAVVGAAGHAGAAGRAYVFTETKGAWKQRAELKGSDTAAVDHLGASVAISGTTAVVGEPEHAKNTGRAYVFTETKGAWKQRAELKGSDTVSSDYFGSSVAISGTTAVVGAHGHANSTGRAYVFTEAKGAWKQAAELQGSDTVPGDLFGYSVAVSGTTAVVGTPEQAADAGRAYVFTKTTRAWKRAAELQGSNPDTDDVFGFSVAISGAAAVVGAYGHAKNIGQAYVFEA